MMIFIIFRHSSSILPIKTTTTPISIKKQTPTKINNNRIKKKKKVLTPSEKRAKFRKEVNIVFTRG